MKKRLGRPPLPVAERKRREQARKEQRQLARIGIEPRKGGPPVMFDEPMTESLLIRVTASQKAAVRRASKSAGKTVSDYLRDKVL